MTSIAWFSGAPWAPTGYGSQTALFTPRLRDAGHEIAIASSWGLGGYTLQWNDITVFPADGVYGKATLGHYAKKVKADLVITLLDVWPLFDLWGSEMRTLNLASWVPVDHAPCPPKVANYFGKFAARPIAMSRFGEQMLKDEGLDPLYVPHGVDTNIFKPSEDSAAFRKLLGCPDDAFVVGMVANNVGHAPSRKAFPQAIQAFAAFRQKHPDAFLYFHSEVSGTREQGDYAGVPLLELCEFFEIPPSAVGFTPQIELESGIPSAWMSELYSAFDVLLNPSYGEGFGIPIIEAQAAGTPVIVTDWTAMPELCGAGWAVQGEPYFDSRQKAFFLSPFVGDIFAALNEAYESASSLRGKAREFALGYDADLVTETFWKPALAALMAPREVGPLPNREMRRRAAKKRVAA